jgi:hypothetical protein
LAIVSSKVALEESSAGFPPPVLPLLSEDDTGEKIASETDVWAEINATFCAQ